MSSFKEFEQKAWEKKANLYEDSWGAVTGQAIDKILEIAGITQGISLLDIGCGPGHFCHKAQLKGAAVLGCDHANEMVKIAAKNFPTISFRSEDAEGLTFAAESFDVVTLNYLLLHVQDQKRVLLEAARVLKKGGILIFTLWSIPVNRTALKIIFDATKKYADMSLIPPAEDIFQFARSDDADRFLTTNGFTDFQVEIVNTAWQEPSTDRFFSSVLAGTRMGGIIDIQSADIREKIKAQISEDLTEFKTSTGYIVPMPSVITSARKNC